MLFLIYVIINFYNNYFKNNNFLMNLLHSGHLLLISSQVLRQSKQKIWLQLFDLTGDLHSLKHIGHISLSFLFILDNKSCKFNTCNISRLSPESCIKHGSIFASAFISIFIKYIIFRYLQLLLFFYFMYIFFNKKFVYNSQMRTNNYLIFIVYKCPNWTIIKE